MGDRETCIECVVNDAKLEDPRDPPIEEGVCLCKGCALDAYIEVEADLEHELEETLKHIVMLTG